MDYNVASVDEALGLLLLVAQNPGFGVTDLSKKSGITKARAFRLLSTLEHRGFVQRQAAATYFLSYNALLVGLAADEQVTLARQAQKHLQVLATRFNEIVQIRVRDGFESISVARWDSSHDVRVHGSVGMRRPLHGGASGKLLLAYAPSEFLDEFFSHELKQYTSNTIVSRAQFMREAQSIRQKGYAVSEGEMADGVYSVAAPVRDGSGVVIAAMAISIPGTRMADDLLETLAPALCEAAAKLSAEMGFRATAELE